MRTLNSFSPLYFLLSGILMLATAVESFAQASSTMGPLAAKVAAKLEDGKTLATASPGDIREAVEAAVAENTGQSKDIVIEVLNFLAGVRVGGLSEKLVIAVMKGAFAGAPMEASATAEAAIEAYPEWRETIMRLLNRRAGGPFGGAGPGPGFGGGPGGVGGVPDDDDNEEVTPDKPN